jgi:hypothetical protein
MSFLNPALLFGLSAIAVPIIIHLLNRRQFRRIEWGAMRFVLAAIEQNRRRLLLEDLLLLAVRCLLVALVALALARPALRATTFSLFGRAHVTAVVVLDASASLRRTDGVESAFDRARRAAEEVVDALPAGSSVAVWTASDAVAPLIAEPTFDLELARRVIRDARPTDRATDLLPAVEKALQALQGRPSPGRELTLITDGQALGWRRLDAALELLRGPLARDVQARVVLVGGRGEEENLAVSDLRLAAGAATAGRPVRFEADVLNAGRREARDVRVTLAADPDPPADEAAIPVLPPGQTRTVSLAVRFREPGHQTVTARLPEDRVPGDDRRTMAVRVVEAVPVLAVDGGPAAGGREGGTFFLRHALQPAGAGGAAASPYRVTVVPASAFGGMALDGHEAVILSDVPDLPPAQAEALRRWVGGGGALLVFPGPRTDAAYYNKALFETHGLLPASLGEPQGDAEARERHASIQGSGYDHPVTALWNDPAAGSLAAARFYRWYPISVGGAFGPEKDAGSGDVPEAGSRPEGRSYTTIARWGDGAPAVVERAVERGRVILFGSSAHTDWNDLPVRPAFVPLVHRALGWALAGRLGGINVRAGQAFTWRAGPERINRTAVFTVPGPDGPVRHSRETDVLDGGAALRWEATDTAGPCEVSVSGDPPLTLRFAVQPDPAESFTERLSPAEIRKLEQGARVGEWTPGGSLREEIRRARVGTELWKPLAALAAALGALETWLAHLFTKPRKK